MSDAEILQPGHNCWRLAHADRAALLVDGDAYFSALRRAARSVKHSIFIIGWDIDSRTPFPPNGEDDGLPRALGKFLDALVERNRRLHVYVLDWDFAMLYALDREILPIYNLGWRTHKRLHFHLDDRHPAGGVAPPEDRRPGRRACFRRRHGSHHGRWDTSRHAPDEPHRRTSRRQALRAVSRRAIDGRWRSRGGSGRARAQALAARDRPRAARRRAVPAEACLWPSAVEAGIRGHRSRHRAHRTRISGRRARCTRCFSSISTASRAAEHSIYIENQYFTAPVIGQAIAERLAEPDGPEIVIVTRRSGGGWLERNTMEVLRARLMRRLGRRRTSTGACACTTREQAGLGENDASTCTPS